MITEVIRSRPPTPPVLLAGRGVGPVERALSESGIPVTRWVRWAEPEAPAPRPWAPDGVFGSALLRLPRSKEEFEMEAHALLSRVRPGGVLLLFGARDEGIVSAPRRIEDVLGGEGSVATLTVKARCRVLALARGGDGAPVRSDLDEWARRGPLEVQGNEVPWTWFPGLFAEGRLDPGTALLLRHLPSVGPGAKVLDYGCGTGVIGATVLAIAPTAEVDLLDADALALEAARRNVPGARARMATWTLREVDATYDCILSNPPFHQGKGETLEPVRALISDAPEALTRRGALALVTQRRLPVGPLLEERFQRVEVPAEDSVFRVWWASRPR